MSRLNTLIDEQNTVWTRMQDIQRASETENRDMTAEERANWDAAEARLTEVSGDIERLHRHAALEKIDYRQVVETGTVEEGEVDPAARRSAAYAEAFGAYMRDGMSGLNSEQQRMLRAESEEIRALAGGTDSAGGFLVPDEFNATMTETMKAFGGLLNEANVITTATGAKLEWPTNDDTSNVGALLGENTQISEQDFTFGSNDLGAYTYTSKLVRVPWTLLQDSAFNLEPWLAAKLGERIGRAQAAHLATGTGTNQPQGLMTGATVGVTGAVSAQAAITYDDLIDLEHSVNPAYRGNAKYVLGDGALKLIRKLKDADNRPLWVPIPAPGFPATINGVPYTLDMGVADPAVSAKSIAFGDIKRALLVRQVKSIQLVTMKERYADYLQNGYFSYARMDSVIDDPAAVRVFQHGAAS